MKKILSFLMFFILPLGLAIPGYMGWQTEQTMRSTVAYIDALPEYGAQWKSYHRGWFTSSASLDLTVNTKQSKGLAVTLPLQFTLQHGPILKTKTLGLGWFDLDINLSPKDEQSLTEILDVKGEGPVYRLIARMGLSGNTHFSDRWLAFDYNNNIAVSVESYSGTGSIDNHLQFEYRYKLPRLKVSNQLHDEFALEDIGGLIAIDFAGLNAANVAPGQFDIQVRSVTGQGKKSNEKRFAVNDLSLSVNTTVDEQQSFFASTVDLLAGSVEVPTQDLLLENFQFTMSYQQISLIFLQRYQELLAQAPADAGADYWQLHAGRLFIEEFLPASPKLSVERFSFQTRRGEFLLSSQLSVDGEAIKFAQLAPENPFGILPYLVCDIDASLDKNLAEHLAALYITAQDMPSSGGDVPIVQGTQNAVQAQELIDALQLQNIVVTKDNKLFFEFNLSKGQAILNKQPMPLPF